MELYRALVTRAVYESPDKKGSVIDVILTPSFLEVKGVELPRLLGAQSQVAVNDLVFIWRPNEYTAVLLSKLKEDPEYLKQSLRSETKDGEQYFQPGEIQVESRGGAYHYISNKGDYHIVGGVTNNSKIRVEGSTNTIINEGMSLDYRTLGKCRVTIQSFIPSVPPDPVHPIATDEISLQIHDWQNPIPTSLIAEIKMNEKGNILIQKRDGLPGPGVELAAIELTELNNIELRNTLLGSINLGSGATRGVVRLGDTVMSTTVDDPSFFTFLSALHTAFNSWIPTGTPADTTTLKSLLAATWLALTPPVSLTSKTIEASMKVKAVD